MLSLLSQPLYSTVLNENSNNLLPFFFRCVVLITTELHLQNGSFYYTAALQYSTRKKNAIFSASNFIVLSLMYHALISA